MNPLKIESTNSLILCHDINAKYTARTPDDEVDMYDADTLNNIFPLYVMHFRVVLQSSYLKLGCGLRLKCKG